MVHVHVSWMNEIDKTRSTSSSSIQYPTKCSDHTHPSRTKIEKIRNLCWWLRNELDKRILNLKTSYSSWSLYVVT